MSPRMTPPDQRLNGGKRVSKYANKSNPRDEAMRLAELEKARNKLLDLVSQYRKNLLTNKTLPENRSDLEKDGQNKLLEAMYVAAQELDLRNVGEGTMVLVSTCLHTNLVLRDEVNKLRFQNYYLNKTVESLKTKDPVDTEPVATTTEVKND